MIRHTLMPGLDDGCSGMPDHQACLIIRHAWSSGMPDHQACLIIHFTKNRPEKLRNRPYLGQGGGHPDLIGPMRSPSGGAYLIISLHPTTPHQFPAILPFWSGIWSFWPFSHTRGGVGVQNRTKSRFLMERGLLRKNQRTLN